MTICAQPDWRDLPGIPGEGPVFAEPWQAQAFALAVAMQARGLFTWGEWATTLNDTIARARAAGDPDRGDTYYHHWLATLETIIAAKRIADPRAIDAAREAWRHAAARTPHGQPIELRDDDWHG